jgi:actin-related protein 8
MTVAPALRVYCSNSVSRVQAALHANGFRVEKVEILSAPREIDPRILAWKGAAVLNKLDTTKEMWLTEKEWSLFGENALQERILFVW